MRWWVFCCVACSGAEQTDLQGIPAEEVDHGGEPGKPGVDAGSIADALMDVLDSSKPPPPTPDAGMR